MDDDIKPCGIVQLVSLAGYPMQGSMGVEWNREVSSGQMLYTDGDMREATRRNDRRAREECAEICKQRTLATDNVAEKCYAAISATIK